MDAVSGAFCVILSYMCVHQLPVEERKRKEQRRERLEGIMTGASFPRLSSGVEHFLKNENVSLAVFSSSHRKLPVPGSLFQNLPFTRSFLLSHWAPFLIAFAHRMSILLRICSFLFSLHLFW